MVSICFVLPRGNFTRPFSKVDNLYNFAVVDKNLIVGALIVLLATVIIGVASVEDTDEIGHRYFMVSNVDSMMVYGDSLCGPDKTYVSNTLAMKWYKKAAEQGSAKSLVRMGTIYREGWSDEESNLKALECYQDAIAIDSMDIEALTEAGRTIGLYVGNYRMGHDYLDMALEIDSTYLEALWYKVRLYVKQDNDVQMSKFIHRIDVIDSTFIDRKLEEEKDDS